MKNTSITTIFLDIGGVVYMDDVQTFVDPATDLGIKSIRYTDFLSTSKALTSIGLHMEQNKLYNG